MSRQQHKCDVAVLGAGFAGSLIALIARRIGLSVALLEQGQHPRFAIGESSTPLANLKLAQLADRYRIDELKPLTKYGPWKSHRPDIACGLKRGFSFFKHERGQLFGPSAEHHNELLVAANPDDYHGDTHWYRPDFDDFINRLACDAGVMYRDRFMIDEIALDDQWLIRGHDHESETEVAARFCIDATGPAAILAKRQTADDTQSLKTCSRTFFGHFQNVARWADFDAPCDGHVFPCDAAALHHIIDNGWMWVLRFDNGITSAGFSLSPSAYPTTPNTSPEREWKQLVEHYPSIRQQFADAIPVVPLRQTERIQRKLDCACGANWLALPHTACFVDPWLSAGLAQTMYGIERAADILETLDEPTRLNELLQQYDRSVAMELDLVDRITSTCFANFHRFDSLINITMLYFAAAITCEECIRAGEDDGEIGFLLANNPTFRSVVESCCELACDEHHDSDELAELVRDQLKPYNSADLCNPSRRNMYPFTGTI